MRTRHIAPATQWQEPATRALLWIPIFPIYNAVTGDLDWDDAGPANCSLVYDGTSGEVEIDSTPGMAGALRSMMDVDGYIIFTT